MEIDALRPSAVGTQASSRPAVAKTLYSSVQTQMAMVLANALMNNQRKEMS